MKQAIKKNIEREQDIFESGKDIFDKQYEELRKEVPNLPGKSSAIAVDKGLAMIIFVGIIGWIEECFKSHLNLQKHQLQYQLQYQYQHQPQPDAVEKSDEHSYKNMTAKIRSMTKILLTNMILSTL